MMDYRLKPPGSSALTGRNPIAKSFAEDATAAQNGIAPKTAHKNNQLDASAAKRQVCRPASI
jgi:hypothetical protein